MFTNNITFLCKGVLGDLYLVDLHFVRSFLGDDNFVGVGFGFSNIQFLTCNHSPLYMSDKVGDGGRSWRYGDDNWYAMCRKSRRQPPEGAFAASPCHICQGGSGSGVYFNFILFLAALFVVFKSNMGVFVSCDDAINMSARRHECRS